MGSEALEGLVSTDVFATAAGLVLTHETFQLLLYVFGVCIVLIFSIVAIWMHVREGKIS